MARSRSRVAARHPIRIPPGDAAEHLEVVSDDVRQIVEGVEALEREGSRPSKTWAMCLHRGRMFTAWLEASGLPVDELRRLSPIDGHGKPQIHPAVVIAYLDHLARPEVKPRTLDGVRWELIGFCRGTGWSTAHLEGSGPAAAAIGAFVRNHRFDDLEAHVRVPARPVTGTWVDAIADAIDACSEDGSSELWVEAIRTFHLVTTFAGLRAGEAVNRLRWSWVHVRDGALHLETPGGHVLKYQPTSRTLVVPCRTPGIDGCVRPERCPLHQLLEWRALLTELGQHCGPDDLVFPAVRRYPDRRSNAAVAAVWQGRALVADPVTEAVERLGPIDGDRRASSILAAETLHRRRYSVSWQRAAQRAGFEPRHRFEKLAAHGLRRGAATRMAANGASLLAISHHLRHGSPNVTGLYIDAAELTYPDPRPLFDLGTRVPAGGNVRGGAPPGLELGDGSVRRPTECEVTLHDGSQCPSPLDSTILVDGTAMGACRFHGVRHRRGWPAERLGAPKRGRPLPAGCGLVFDGVPCGRSPAGWCRLPEGDVALCRGHAKRFYAGRRGETLARPLVVRNERAPLCEVAHEGELCGRSTQAPTGGVLHVDGVRLTACNAHYLRWRAGKRGQAFTEPVRERRRRSVR